VTEAGLHNISFTQSDLSQITTRKLFDAAAGRFILEFLSDPVDTCAVCLSSFVPEESSPSKPPHGCVFLRFRCTCRFGLPLRL